MRIAASGPKYKDQSTKTIYFKRSGRFRFVFARAASRRQRAMSA
jgi:hypothetical protein